MVKLKFRERVGHNSMMVGLGYNPEVMVMVVVEATVNSLKIRKVRCLVVTGGENERMIGTLSLVIVPPETIYIYIYIYIYIKQLI